MFNFPQTRCLGKDRHPRKERISSLFRHHHKLDTAHDAEWNTRPDPTRMELQDESRQESEGSSPSPPTSPKGKEVCPDDDESDTLSTESPSSRPSRNKSSSRKRKNRSFYLRARSIFLTYSQCPMSPTTLLRVVKVITTPFSVSKTNKSIISIWIVLCLV